MHTQEIKVLNNLFIELQLVKVKNYKNPNVQ